MSRSTPPPPPPPPPPPIVDLPGDYTVERGFDRSLVGVRGPVTLSTPLPSPPIVDLPGHCTVERGFDRSLVGVRGPVSLSNSSPSHVDSQGQSTCVKSPALPALAPRDVPIDSASQQPPEAAGPSRAAGQPLYDDYEDLDDLH